MPRYDFALNCAPRVVLTDRLALLAVGTTCGSTRVFQVTSDKCTEVISSKPNEEAGAIVSLLFADTILDKTGSHHADYFLSVVIIYRTHYSLQMQVTPLSCLFVTILVQLG
jgi:hypothetical protein